MTWDGSGWQLDFSPVPPEGHDVHVCAYCKTTIHGEWTRYDAGVHIEFGDGLAYTVPRDVNLCGDLCRTLWLDDLRQRLITT